MKRLSMLIIIGLVCATAYGGTVSIITSFKSPASFNVRGIDFHAGYIYHSSTRSASTIYKTTTTGSVVQTIAANPVGGALTAPTPHFGRPAHPARASSSFQQPGVGYRRGWLIRERAA